MQRQDILSREPLREMEERLSFLEAEGQEEDPAEQKADFFSPDPLKLSPISYKTILSKDWCVISYLNALGGNQSNYEFERRSKIPTYERFIKYTPEDGHPEPPSYLHFKKVSASQEAGDVIVYMFKDDEKTPRGYPLRLKL